MTLCQDIFVLLLQALCGKAKASRINTAILLGAGSSLAAGFPSTKALTDLILSGNGVTRESDSSYYINNDDGPPYEETRLANCMVQHFHAEAERYYSAYAERHSNYEGLFYLAHQASDDLSGEMENPAVSPFVGKLRAHMSTLIEAARNADCPNRLSLDDLHLLEETRHYIADIVWRALCHKPKPEALSHLGVIAHACNSVNYRVTSISTLCHDTHVETFLERNGISLADGFDAEPQAGVRYWNGDFSSGGKTPFLKLHGSVNWFRLRPDSGDFYDEKIGIPLDHYQRTRTVDGTLQTAVDGRPLLLIGTFNKISEYSSGIFRELHHRFRSTILNANQMVVCGYGFGDKGINSEIIDWIYDRRGRRLLIIHPNPDGLVANARGAIRKYWPEWKKNGLISIIGKRFQDVGIDEFDGALAGPCLEHRSRVANR